MSDTIITDGTAKLAIRHKGGGFRLSRNTHYTIGDMVFYPDIPSGYFLQCVNSGITGSSSLDFSSIREGMLLSDGIVTWVVYGLSYLGSLSYIVSSVQTIMDKIGITIPDIDFNKSTFETLKEFTNKTTSWNNDVSVEIPYSGYYYLYGTGTYSGYTDTSRAMYMQVDSHDVIRGSGSTQGRDTACGPVWLYEGIKNVTVGYVGFSKVRLKCFHM